MKTYKLILLEIIGISLLFLSACSFDPKNNKLEGNWVSKGGDTKLKITGKEFLLVNESPVAEDYFVKNDTIFTSFEGNQPYTKFLIKKLDDKNLTLLFPDSVVIEFTR